MTEDEKIEKDWIPC